jgi:hypothetical protein
MAFEPKEGAITLFLNDKWGGEKHPILRGKTKVNGKILELALWLPDGFPEEDMRFLPQRLSGKFSEPKAFEPKAQQPAPAKQASLAEALDDDIPF